MASWNAITDASWTGKIITVSEWNNYFGAGGSLVYLKEGYTKYYTSFYAIRSVPTSVTTTGTSFRIPNNWTAGLYFTALNIFVNAAQEPVVDTRRTPLILVNNVTLANNNFVSVASSFTFKPIYYAGLYTRLSPNDHVEYKLFQNSTVTSFIFYGTLQKVGL